MILLIIFAFLAGIVTILSPCILPVLPIILSSTVNTGEQDRARPLGIITGFIISFSFFTLFLSTLVAWLGIPASTMRYISIIIVALLGLSMIIPPFQLFLEKLMSKLSSLLPVRNNSQTGFGIGIITGLSLGLLWTPCVGPILGSVIALAVSGAVNLQAALIILAYAIGTAIPMLAIMLGGRALLQKAPWLVASSGKIQKVFGVIMILTALALATNYDRRIQLYLLDLFPNYSSSITKLENQASVLNKLKSVNMASTSDIVNSFYPKAAELKPGGDWYNLSPEQAASGGLKLSNLKGKVVLLDFWTYTCINCQRTLPYVQAWHEKYKDEGLVIIGAHAPEFAFEKDSKNVAAAIKTAGLTYPIFQDNNFGTWQAYDNHYWPAKYLIDKAGRIRYTHFGEGDYNETEAKIQELLQEDASSTLPMAAINNPEYQIYARTGETYVGYSRVSNFASPEDISNDKAATYSYPKTLSANAFALAGEWTVHEEEASPAAKATLSFDFNAKEVFLVMKPSKFTARVKVYLDGQQDNLGADAKDGIITVNADRLYKLINLPTPGRHVLKLEFLDDNAQLFAFTFG